MARPRNPTVPSRLWIRSRRPFTWGLLVVLMLTSMIASVAIGRPSSPADARLIADQEPTLPPAQIVLLVDESGSLSADGVTREKEAARTIALGAVAPDTTVSVVGFGSSDGSPGQAAAITRCPPTKVDSGPSRDTLAQCIDRVHARTPAEGFHTDHVAALRQALGFLSSSTPAAKIVFLLTDGNLDVQDSPAYGRDLGPEARDQAARDQIPGVLAKLQETGAQVWPLGFGRQVSLDKLKDFATGQPCTPTATAPEATVIENPAMLTSAIIAAYKSAGCVGGGDLDTGTLPKASTVDLTVDIPAIASDSSILVYKRNAGIQVQYIDPNGTTAVGVGSGDSTFQFAGQGTETESLHIIDPVFGRWTVRLTSTSDTPPQEVAATVLFQGAVNAVIAITPPQPAKGQDVEVAMQVRARRMAVTDPTLLKGLTFRMSLTGSSGFPKQEASLSDDDKDGTFTTRLTIPANATGNLTFTGTVTGIGIGGDTRVVTTTVQGQAADLQGQLRLTGTDTTVEPGGSVPGEASITNKSGRERALRLQLVEPGPGTITRVDPSVIKVPASGTAVVPFSIVFDTGTVLGGNQALLQAVDDADPSLVVARQLIARDVAPPPTFLERFLWLWIVLATLLGLGAVLLVARLRTARENQTIEGLRVELRRGGIKVHELQPLDGKAKVFRFLVYDDGFTAPQLQHADPGDASAYEVRRASSTLTLTPVSDASPVIRPGEPRAIGSDRAIVVYDHRFSSGDAPRSGADLGVSSGSGNNHWDAFNGAGHPTQTFGGNGATQRNPVPPHFSPGDLAPPSSPSQSGAGGWEDPHDHWRNL